MIVYRYTSEQELNAITQGKKEDIGNFNNNETEWSSFNTHKYKLGHKYLHFFKNKKSIKYLKMIRKGLDKKKMYICSYNIPRSVLRTCKGKGDYDSTIHGYDEYQVSLTEYAVDVNDFSCEWLVDIEKDNITTNCGEPERQ